MRIETSRPTSIGTISIPYEEVTFWHFPQVELMKKLACLSLLAKTSQPMLAHQVIKVPAVIGGDMFIRAVCTERAVSLEICFTCRPIR
jgi:hypothetical protein